MVHNNFDINKCIDIFLYDVISYLERVAKEKTELSRLIEDNIKNILTIKRAPKIWLNPESRIKANLAISPVGFRRGFGKNYDQTRYKMFYNMLYLLNSYCITNDKKERANIQYNIESLYASWHREISNKNFITEGEYYKRIIQAKLNMAVAKINNFLSR